MSWQPDHRMRDMPLGSQTLFGIPSWRTCALAWGREIWWTSFTQGCQSAITLPWPLLILGLTREGDTTSSCAAPRRSSHVSLRTYFSLPHALSSAIKFSIVCPKLCKEAGSLRCALGAISEFCRPTYRGASVIKITWLLEACVAGSKCLEKLPFLHIFRELSVNTTYQKHATNVSAASPGVQDFELASKTNTNKFIIPSKRIKMRVRRSRSIFVPSLLHAAQRVRMPSCELR